MKFKDSTNKAYGKKPGGRRHKWPVYIIQFFTILQPQGVVRVDGRPAGCGLFFDVLAVVKTNDSPTSAPCPLFTLPKCSLPMMKATLTAAVYKRRHPAMGAEVLGSLPAGASITIQKLELGEAWEDVSIWVQASDGGWFWSGALHIAATPWLLWSHVTQDLQIAILQQCQTDSRFWAQMAIPGFLGCGWMPMPAGCYGLLIFVEHKQDHFVYGATVRYTGMEVPCEWATVHHLHHDAQAMELLLHQQKSPAQNQQHQDSHTGLPPIKG
jgi:hypothetical protein